jgi:hypothetical protein
MRFFKKSQDTKLKLRFHQGKEGQQLTITHISPRTEAIILSSLQVGDCLVSLDRHAHYSMWTHSDVSYL